MRFLLLSGLWLLVSVPCKAEPILADLSQHAIDISTTFRGANLLLFGARNDAGDIVVVVRGPEKNYVVRKKERIGGIWVNRHQQTFLGVPSFYAIASSRPLNEMENVALLQSYSVGGEFLKPERVEGDAKNKEFWSAFAASQKKKSLYPTEEGDISFWGETLFKTTLEFPKNIARGRYLTEVYLFRDGELGALQTTPIVVKKIGFEAYIYQLAHRVSFLYGLLCVGLAYLAGWVASNLFRKI